MQITFMICPETQSMRWSSGWNRGGSNWKPKKDARRGQWMFYVYAVVRCPRRRRGGFSKTGESRLSLWREGFQVSRGRNRSQNKRRSGKSPGRGENWCKRSFFPRGSEGELWARCKRMRDGLYSTTCATPGSLRNPLKI